MQQPRTFSRKKLLVIVILLAVIGILTGVASAAILRHHTAVRKTAFGLSDSITMKRYSAANGAYMFSYPDTWTVSPDTNPLINVLTYTVGHSSYELTISPPGQINPEGVPDGSHDTQIVTYGQQAYSRTVWSTAGKPFYITAVPLTSDSTYYVLAMRFPPGGLNDALAAFGKVATSLTY